MLLNHTNSKVYVPDLWQEREKAVDLAGDRNSRTGSDRISDFCNMWLSRLSTAIQPAEPRIEKVEKSYSHLNCFGWEYRHFLCSPSVARKC